MYRIQILGEIVKFIERSAKKIFVMFYEILNQKTEDKKEKLKINNKFLINGMVPFIQLNPNLAILLNLANHINPLKILQGLFFQFYRLLALLPKN